MPTTSPAARSGSASLALVVVLFGLGCSPSEPDPLPQSTTPDVPRYANPLGLKVGGNLQNASIIEETRKAIEKSHATQTLISHYRDLGYQWQPTSTDYVAEAEADGSALVGISHRRVRAGTNETAWLVALFRFKAPTLGEPQYLYAVTYTPSTTPPFVRYWLDAGGIIQSLGYPPPGQTFRFPTLPAGVTP